jgi:hypothetical protein
MFAYVLALIHAILRRIIIILGGSVIIQCILYVTGIINDRFITFICITLMIVMFLSFIIKLLFVEI